MALPPQIPPRQPFQASAEARLIGERLLTMQVGESVSYDVLAQLAGMDKVEGSTTALRTARKMALRAGIVVECVPTVGVTRLDDDEILDLGDKGIVSVRRKARRTNNKVTLVDFAALPNAAKLRFSTITSVLGLQSWFGRDKQVREISQAAQGLPTGQRRLSIGASLDMFRKAK